MKKENRNRTKHKHRNKNKNKKPRIDVSKVKLKDINYKNPELLSNFLDLQFGLKRKKYTKFSSKFHRKLNTEIKKAREMALLKYTDRH